MTEAPKVVVLELEDKDVEGDISKIIKSMSEIRAETMTDRKLSDTQRDEYLHLAYRLASGIEGIADNGMFSKMQRITKILEKNNILLSYDPLQDGYWKKREKEFVQTLDDLLFSVVKDDFETIETKHHVLQAVKYLAVKDGSFEERELIYNTILPFNKAILPKDMLLERFRGSIFGKAYKIEKTDDLTLRVFGKCKDLDSLLEDVHGLGYKRMVVDINDRNLDKIKEKHEFHIVENDVHNDRLRKIVANTIKYTMPISYPIIGTLPMFLQKRLAKYVGSEWESFGNPGHQFGRHISSSMGEIGFGILGTIITTNSLYAIPALGGLIRLIIGAISSGYIRIGSIPLELGTLPLNLYLKKKKDNVSYRIGILLGKDEKKTVKHEDKIGYLEKIATAEVPEEIEKNLVWGTDNNSNFANKFIAYLQSVIKDNGSGVNTKINKKHNALVYHNMLDSEGYKKNSGTFCFNGKRYLVTAIGNDNNFVDSATEILSDSKTIEEKAKSLFGNLNARYLHLREFQNGKDVNDYEVTA